MFGRQKREKKEEKKRVRKQYLVSPSEFPSPQLFCFHIIINVTKPDHYGEAWQPLWAATLHFNFRTNRLGFRGNVLIRFIYSNYTASAVWFLLQAPIEFLGNIVLILKNPNKLVSLKVLVFQSKNPDVKNSHKRAYLRLLLM